jgi:hypothetical protein
MMLRVDFNNVADDGVLVKGSLRHADDPNHAAEPGESIFLYDGEGNDCYGYVDHVEGQIVYVRLDDSTWHAAGEPTTGEIETKGRSAAVRLRLRERTRSARSRCGRAR